ncbi:type II toxin-antitoxin system RelE/ParE family toxin [Sinorhizobium meliloti]|nr:type II toxin-antitoxin system RelE/ParE family toxin [Sinorhizobium meliloti]MQW47269.1 type II toxin-antitoxin system RelE/ParE family toxin [Sinorhizobium meliloti]RVL03081.1 type II toxin-antitoxin system RelE/ParE family toxin [Sinorhizobium meliloti]RVN49147.1 type II toxin-antitoxin system RelE/ParE family toxin [Sinorhizobium meliloti]RVQ01030.1 type II toxin-antitoxin system RelE/ParE family toxin [Sinorhizobium meliloti]
MTRYASILPASVSDLTRRDAHRSFHPGGSRPARHAGSRYFRAASPAVAARYVDSIVDYCGKLQTFPHRGTRRDDLRPGLRTLGFRRRVTILFGADGTVNIIGVYYGGQDYEAPLRDGDLTEIEHDDDES